MGVVLEARDISKRFGALQALEGVSVAFASGEIHAVVGENGAGKSTFMHVLRGALRPDAGALAWPAGRRTIAMVHQHFMLVPEFTVAENLLLGSVARPFRLRRELELEPVLGAAASLGWSIDLEARTGDLPVGVQQRIEILKALATGADLLIFDEPTAVLSRREVAELFEVLRKLAGDGKAVVLIAHKLDEVLAIADRISVLRRGRLVATEARAAMDAASLAQLMVGELPQPVAKPGFAASNAAVSVRDLHVRGDRGELAVDGFSLDVGQGEIVGIGGVDGNGQVELAEALAGVRPAEGTIEAGGPEESLDVAYIPQDRHRDGLALDLSIFENFVITGKRRPLMRKGLLLDIGRLWEWAAELVRRFDVRLHALGDPIRTLSGGNQQKAIVARTLDHDPNLLVAVNPTRGLDVQAAHAVHTSLLEKARSGVPIVLISTDADELTMLADRVFTLSRGRLTEGLSAEAWVGGS